MLELIWSNGTSRCFGRGFNTWLIIIDSLKFWHSPLLGGSQDIPNLQHNLLILSWVLERFKPTKPCSRAIYSTYEPNCSIFFLKQFPYFLNRRRWFFWAASPASSKSSSGFRGRFSAAASAVWCSRPRNSRTKTREIKQSEQHHHYFNIFHQA